MNKCFLFQFFVILFCVDTTTFRLEKQCLKLLEVPLNTDSITLEKHMLTRLLECMNSRYDNIEERLKSLTCGQKLRYSIDLFDGKLLMVPEAEWSKMGVYLTQVTNLVTKRRQKLSNIIKIFGGVIAHSHEDEKSWIRNFENGLKLLREVPLSPDSRVTSEIPDHKNLHNALLQLSKTISTDEAKEFFWGLQKSFWTELVQSDPKVLEILKAISENLPVSEVNKLLETINSFTDRIYVVDILKDGRLFKEFVSERYKRCMWAMHHSSSQKRMQIERDLEKLWPGPIYDLSARRHSFCSYMSNLYQVASDTDFHSPGGGPLPSYCRPGTNDFIDYANHIAAEAGDEVLSSVGLIIMNLYASHN